MAEIMHNQGTIFAFGANPITLNKLRSKIALCGISCVFAENKYTHPPFYIICD